MVPVSTRECSMHVKSDLWRILYFQNVCKMRSSIIALVVVDTPAFHPLACIQPYWGGCWLWSFHAVWIKFRKEKHSGNAAGLESMCRSCLEFMKMLERWPLMYCSISYAHPQRGRQEEGQDSVLWMYLFDIQSSRDRNQLMHVSVLQSHLNNVMIQNGAGSGNSHGALTFCLALTLPWWALWSWNPQSPFFFHRKLKKFLRGTEGRQASILQNIWVMLKTIYRNCHKYLNACNIFTVFGMPMSFLGLVCSFYNDSFLYVWNPSQNMLL